MTKATERIQVLVILGPTASGKTGLAIELGRRFGGEVISQDSRQVYRYMDIGTAKPTPEERSAAPHHGLDLVDPDGNWTLAQQQRFTYDTVVRLHRVGKLPMLVGGTGQYLRAVLEGWTIPKVPPDEPLRARLRAEAAEIGVPRLHARLREIDPAAGEQIMPNDLRRITRALEVWELTGKRLSEQQRAEPPPYDVLLLGLTMSREELYARIDSRVGEMLRAGLLEEIRALLDRGYDWSLPAMRTIGYGEFEPYLAGEATLAECRQRLCYNTHRFARHQYVWFRRFQDTICLDATGTELLPTAAGSVARWMTIPGSLQL